MTTSDPRRIMWNEALAMIARAEQLHQRFIEPGGSGACWEPPVDIFETADEFWIIAALPGVEKDDLKLSIDGDVLRVAGRRRLHVAARTAAVHRLEIPYGRFERSIRLPAQLLTLDRSELVNGCLVIRLGKA
ncbi:Hsp20/alpha crystallin family protein [Taklimakanibacter deserti]|uniref:Hsp20/alpha crystallin family protein n=1 Tax=Taklimakanibacter deserti TaxID=2267839 RepID=UPI0034D48996